MEKVKNKKTINRGLFLLIAAIIIFSLAFVTGCCRCHHKKSCDGYGQHKSEHHKGCAKGCCCKDCSKGECCPGCKCGSPTCNVKPAPGK